MVWFVYGCQGRIYLLGSKVLLLLVDVSRHIIGRDFRLPAFYNIGRCRCFIGREGTPLFVLAMTLAFGRFYEVHEVFVYLVSNIYISALFQILVGEQSRS